MTAPVDAMVDTMVLIYGTRAVSPKADPTVRAFAAASAQLLRALPQIRVSAVAWFEFLRVQDEVMSDAWKAHAPRLLVESVEPPAAALAAELMRRWRKREKVCPRCSNSRDSHVCKDCGSKIANQQRLNDAIIVAVAETKADVTVLYSCDNGVHELGSHLERATVRYPPNPDGPLFESIPKEPASTPDNVVPIGSMKR